MQYGKCISIASQPLHVQCQNIHYPYTSSPKTGGRGQPECFIKENEKLNWTFRRVGTGGKLNPLPWEDYGQLILSVSNNQRGESLFNPFTPDSSKSKITNWVKLKHKQHHTEVLLTTAFQ